MAPMKFFLVSGQRSGSTLTTLLLGSHPECVSVGESWKLSNPAFQVSPCMCGADHYSTCTFWAAVSERIEERCGVNPFKSPTGFPLYTTNLRGLSRKRLRSLETLMDMTPSSFFQRWLLHALASDPAGRAIAENTIDVLEAAAEVANSAVVVESCKDPRRAWLVQKRRPESTRVLYLVRDGRGVMASYLGQGRSQAKATASTPSAAARRWAEENKQILDVLRTMPDESYLTVRYEQLCAEPETTLKTICRFVGLDYDPVMLTFREQILHNFSGNHMRFSSEHRIKVDDRWRTSCAPEALAMFDRIGGELNRQLGFAD